MIPIRIDVVFEVDGITYRHPSNIDGRPITVTARPMFQLRSDMNGSAMIVLDNKPKKGLMDSEIDEKYVETYYAI